MKTIRWIACVFALLLFVTGCGSAARDSGFWENDTMYKNMDHLKYSWTGFKETSEKDVEVSKDQNWWGVEINYDYEE